MIKRQFLAERGALHISLNLERVLVVDGYFCDDPLDYDLHRARLIRDDLALYFSGDYLVLRMVKRYTDIVNHPRLYISQELKDSVRVAKGVEQTEEICRGGGRLPVTDVCARLSD
ncbi:hypothetical protein P4H42_13455 [Paenibacillus macerans]|uniref:hypothetical protein n=1 Tax=Paenibacillus macerans TaxID=44252 RepID=UPI002DB8B100|nr:hypothetical protein [Paenibacillus macerans]MEC0330620.1 hypothetical protein [Paenibacillus macerans]